MFCLQSVCGAGTGTFHSPWTDTWHTSHRQLLCDTHRSIPLTPFPHPHLCSLSGGSALSSSTLFSPSTFTQRPSPLCPAPFSSCSPLIILPPSRCLSQHEISVFWVPRRSVACERLLEEEGVYGAALHGEFPLELVALEEDVVSLELDRAFRECVLEGDTSSLFYAAAGLVRLQLLYGLIPRIQVRGRGAGGRVSEGGRTTPGGLHSTLTTRCVLP